MIAGLFKTRRGLPNRGRKGGTDMVIDSYAAGAIIIGASSVAAVLGLLAVRRSYDVQALVSAHGVSGQYLSIVGTLYAVLLGLIVVHAMSKFDHAVDIVEEEANALSESIFLAGRMPASRSAKIADLASNYIHLVIEKEWPIMAQGRPYEEARVRAYDLMRAVREWEPISESEKAAYAEAIAVASNFWNAPPPHPRLPKGNPVPRMDRRDSRCDRHGELDVRFCI